MYELKGAALTRPAAESEVIAFHFSPAVFDGEKVDSAALRPLARLGGPYYTTLGQLIHAPILATPPGRR